MKVTSDSIKFGITDISKLTDRLNLFTNYIQDQNFVKAAELRDELAIKIQSIISEKCPTCGKGI